jgi:MSHA biogenesis protein MshJ
MNLSTSLLAGMTRLDALSRRDRGLLLGLAVGLLLLCWHGLVWTPLQQQGARLQAERAQALNGQAALQQEMDALNLRLAQDPDAANRQERERLQQELAALEGELEQTVAGVVTPAEMPALLARLLKDRQGLRLVRLENLPPVPLMERPESNRPEINLFRHPLRIELEGSYLEAMAYLRALEASAPGLSWERLELKVNQHPLARILVVVHTLSAQKEWLGV